MEIKYSHEDFFAPGEQIRTFFSTAHEQKNMHSQIFWEIVYVYEGEANVDTRDGTKKLCSGDFVLIKPESIHSVSAISGDKNTVVRMCNCIFTHNFFKSIAGDYLKISDLSCYTLYDVLNNNSPLVIKLTDDNAQNVRHLLWAIAHEYNHHTAGSEYIIRHSLINLLISLTRLYDYQNSLLSGVVSKNHEIDELAKYIRSNFSYNLSLEFLAQHMHMSREYLSRYFKKHMGKTISEYLLEVRIEKAKQMLKTTSHSINDICFYCGYSTPGNFYKAFKKATGISPSVYKKQFGKF